MAILETISEQRSFGGVQGFYKHVSSANDGPMKFAVYKPPQAERGKVPVLYYLAGLTCTEETFVIKAGAQRLASQLGIMLVAPDTSPRNTGIADEAADWEFGAGAGFYVDATEAPWSAHFKMYSYVTVRIAARHRREFSGRHETRKHFRSFDGWAWCADDRAEKSDTLQIGVGVRADRRAQPGALGAKSVAAISRRPINERGRTTTRANSWREARFPARSLSIRAMRTNSSPTNCVRNCSMQRAVRRVNRSHFACSPDTITAITSSARLWTII